MRICLTLLLVSAFYVNALPEATDTPIKVVDTNETAPIPDLTVSTPTNVCKLPRELGNGTGLFTRWYFDSDTGVCEEFQFTGVNGNANRFISKKDCLLTCTADPCKKVSINGTEVGAFTVNGTIKTCSYSDATKEDDCPNSYYCSMYAGVCCPQETQDVCSLPKAEGIKMYPNVETRRFYYFNNSTGECEPFLFNGSGGNANRFMTKVDCESACMQKTCGISHPYSKVRGPIICEIDGENCPAGFECSPTIHDNVTHCCPKPEPIPVVVLSNVTISDQEAVSAGSLISLVVAFVGATLALLAFGLIFLFPFFSSS